MQYIKEFKNFFKNGWLVFGGTRSKGGHDVPDSKFVMNISFKFYVHRLTCFKSYSHRSENEKKKKLTIETDTLLFVHLCQTLMESHLFSLIKSSMLHSSLNVSS